MKIYFHKRYASLGYHIFKSNFRDMIVWGKSDDPVQEFKESGCDVFAISNFYMISGHSGGVFLEYVDLIKRLPNTLFLIYHEMEEPWQLPMRLQELFEATGGFEYRVLSFHTPLNFDNFYDNIQNGERVDFKVNFEHIGALPFVLHESAGNILGHYKEVPEEQDFDLFFSGALYRYLTMNEREAFFDYGCRRFYEKVLPRLNGDLRIDLDVMPFNDKKQFKYRIRDAYFDMVNRSKITIHMPGGGLQADSFYFDISAGSLSFRSSGGTFMTIFGPEPNVDYVMFDWHSKMNEIPKDEEYDDFVDKFNMYIADDKRRLAMQKKGNKLLYDIGKDMVSKDSKIVAYAQKGLERLIAGDNKMLTAQYQKI